MRHMILAAGFLAAALPAAAQPNPFKLPKSGLKGGAEITYASSGDMSGSTMLAVDGERQARRATTTMKMMGKTTTSDTWTLTTPDSTYTADIAKKKGTVAPNMIPYFAKAYDDLDGDGKKRLHSNMTEMAAVLSRAFGVAGANTGEKTGTKTYAGQECEERVMGSMSVCTMKNAPIMLHTKVQILCINYEETATEVKIGAPNAAAFAAPAGITFAPDQHIGNPDSTAKGYINYLASQQLADSLAKAKAEIEAAKQKQGGQTQLTPEQQAQMQQACEMMKSIDVNKMVADAGNAMLKGMADAAKNAAVDAAKNAAADKAKSIFKKPKIP